MKFISSAAVLLVCVMTHFTAKVETADPPVANANGQTGNSNPPDAPANGQTGNANVPDGNANVPTGNANVPDGNANVPTGNANVPDGNANVPTGNAKVPDANGQNDQNANNNGGKTPSPKNASIFVVADCFSLLMASIVAIYLIF